MSYTLLVADDHPMILEGIRAMLWNHPEFVVAHTADNGLAAWSLVQANADTLDLVVTDVNMPGMDGVELVRRIKQQYPQIRVLVISLHNSPAVTHSLLDAEAEGCILKDAGRQEFVAALNQLVQGKTSFSSEVMVAYMRAQKQAQAAQSVLERFSAREREILYLILAEKTSDEIAEQLFISRRTVDVHRQHILEKSGCRTLVGLIKFAYQQGVG